MNFSPIMKAWAKPSGEGCSAYSNLTPNWLPSPKRRLKPGKSNGVEIMSISRIPATSILILDNISSACRRLVSAAC